MVKGLYECVENHENRPVQVLFHLIFPDVERSFSKFYVGMENRELDALHGMCHFKACEVNHSTQMSSVTVRGSWEGVSGLCLP